MFRDSEQLLNTEEAVNQTYHLLEGILAHFEKFEGLHKTEPTATIASLYSRYDINKNTQASHLFDKKQQFSEDQKLIKNGLNQLNEVIAKYAEQLVTPNKTIP